jgi:hypothetical protein
MYNLKKYSFPAYQESVPATGFFVSHAAGKRHDPQRKDAAKRLPEICSHSAFGVMTDSQGFLTHAHSQRSVAQRMPDFF